MNMIRLCLSNIDKKKAFELALGIIGINITFLVLGIVYQNITTLKYTNRNTGAQQYFRSGAGFIMVERGTNWLMAEVYKFMFIPKQKRISLPWKNSAATAFTIYVSTVAQTQAMFLVSYPFVIMAKSCSLINVILVGVCCSRVRSKQLKLSPNKIIVATIVSIGIVCFKLFDPRTNFQDNKKTQIFGLVLLLASLFADGFTPDFQAQIKQKYKPQPIIMMIEINKWITYICAVHLIVTGEMYNLIMFFWEHPQCSIDMWWICLCSFGGQVFVYRMIRQFKQHIVPFVVTTRKILTVGLSILYFRHDTNFVQISSIITVFFATCYEFYENITKSAPVQQNAIKQLEQESKKSQNRLTQQMNRNELIPQDQGQKSMETYSPNQIQMGISDDSETKK